MYENIILEVLNKNHKIDKYVPKYKWTYTEQYRWINMKKKPDIIIDFEKMNEQIYQLFDVRLEKENETDNDVVIYSNKALKYLNKFYRKDFEIYNNLFN